MRTGPIWGSDAIYDPRAPTTSVPEMVGVGARVQPPNLRIWDSPLWGDVDVRL